VRAARGFLGWRWLRASIQHSGLPHQPDQACSPARRVNLSFLCTKHNSSVILLHCLPPVRRYNLRAPTWLAYYPNTSLANPAAHQTCKIEYHATTGLRFDGSRQYATGSRSRIITFAAAHTERPPSYPPRAPCIGNGKMSTLWQC
jgi:hypothetical protein